MIAHILERSYLHLFKDLRRVLSSDRPLQSDRPLVPLSHLFNTENRHAFFKFPNVSIYSQFIVQQYSLADLKKVHKSLDNSYLKILDFSNSLIKI